MEQTKQTLAILTDYMVVGGVERVLAEALKHLKPYYDITIEVLCGDVGPDVRQLLGTDVKIHCLYSTNPVIRKMLFVPVIGGWILRGMIGRTYDIAICVKPILLMASYGRIGKQNIYWAHNDKDIRYAQPRDLNLLRKINRFRLMAGYLGYDAVWTLCDYLKEKTEEAFGLQNVTVLQNPLDCQLIVENAEEAIDDSVFMEDGLNICCVSRLSAEKAPLRLVKAVEQASKECPCRAIFVGDGPERETLEAYVREHGLSSSVVFVGQKLNPYPYIKRADMFVLPSQSETYALVLLEAMLLGTPIITTDTTAGRCVLENRKYGTMVARSHEEVADEILKFNADAPSLRQRTQLAQKRAWDYDTANFQKNLLKLLHHS